MSGLARVIVTPKPVVNDPQGLTVRHGLRSLGFDEVEQVRVGKYIEVTLDTTDEETSRRRVGEMCEKLLANHVIEDFRFELADPPPSLPHNAGVPAKPASWGEEGGGIPK